MTVNSFEEKLVSLIKKWCHCWEYEASQMIVIEIGIHIGCLDKIPESFSHEERYEVLRHLNVNYPDAYLIATGQKVPVENK